jgi:hypothetical protein
VICDKTFHVTVPENSATDLSFRVLNAGPREVIFNIRYLIGSFEYLRPCLHAVICTSKKVPTIRI